MPNSQETKRELRQAPGLISTIRPETRISSAEEIPPLAEAERRLFGIGQGNLRATPLQVANAFATIARGGLVKQPRLFLPAGPDVRGPALVTRRSKPLASSSHKRPATGDDLAEQRGASIEADLNIARQTLDLVYEGMRAVVAESGGTAYNEFVNSGLGRQDVTVYGKTGSTERPEHAWFAGFAADSTGRKLAIAVVVEGGQRGSSDASPLARDIFQYCIEYGYIGRPPL
jgi:cell division protein FtsI/penicillin-binding protein 2